MYGPMPRSLTLILALIVGACQEREPTIIHDEFMLGPSAAFYFATGRAAISEKDAGIIHDVAAEYREKSKKWGKLFIAVDGHADSTGSEPFNRQLSTNEPRRSPIYWNGKAFRAIKWLSTAMAVPGRW